MSHSSTHPSDLSAMVPNQTPQTRKFMLVTLVVVLVAGLFALALAYRQGVFERHLSYHFTTTSGQNLSRGMPVLFKGFKIGYLDALDLRTDGRITGDLAIKEKHGVFMTEGVSLHITKDKIVTSELVLEAGPPGGAVLPDGGEVVFRTDGGIDALEKRILDRIDPVLAQLSQLMQHLGDPQHGMPAAVEALRADLVQARATLAQVDAVLATANRSFGALDERIRDPRVDAILTHADQTLAGLKSNTEQLNRTLESSQQLMATGQQTLQGSNRELAATLQATRRVLTETVQLMDDVRGSTLGRWLVAPRKPASASETPGKASP